MKSTLNNFRPTVAEINFAALKNNLNKLRNLAGEDTFFCPMIKANAYGHGAVEIGKFYEREGVKQVGASLVEEGIQLRENGTTIDILVFGAFTDMPSAKACLEFNLTPVVGSYAQLNVLEQVDSNKNLNFHLKFDTGMSRLGFPVDQAESLRSKIAKFGNWNLVGVCTHLLKGDDAAAPNGFTAKQIQKFETVVKSFKSAENVVFHMLNSSGLVNLKDTRSFGARPGIALYGGYAGFEQVMTLKSKIITTREVQPGEPVSYNATWTAKRKSLIGIVPIGYADGVPRKLSNQLEVLVRETRVPAVGTVNMDYVLVDLTDLRDQSTSPDMFLGEGEEVVFFGRQGRAEISALEWAKNLDTITYEIFTSISSRVPRIYVGT